MARENFKSRLGFILVSAGCAIGIGNVWRFPYVAGENGGGIFVLFYLIFLLCMGIPVLTMELAVGRATGKSAVGAYKELENAGQKWHIHGWLCMIGNLILMMYYTSVAGWMISYFFKFLRGEFKRNLDAIAVQNVFDELMASPVEMGLWTLIIIVLGFFVCSFGLQNGLERISKFMMISLLVLIVILAVNSATLEGAGEGLKFYLLPDLEKAKEVGIGSVITAAMNQAFFTLSLGIGSMQIFGSYMKKDNTLLSESVRICVLDTFVAVSAGLIIFPACFSFGVTPDAGPSLIFVTLPNVFVNMAGGRIWGTLFFLFMTFASFTTVIAVFENIMASCMDNFAWSRKKATIANCLIVILTSIPCVLGFNIWSDIKLIKGGNVLDTEDFIVSNILLPIGSLMFLLFCTTRYGWGFDKYLEEVNTGEGIKLKKWVKPYFKYVLPILVLVIFINGLI